MSSYGFNSGGGGTGGADDITWTSTVSMGATATALLVCGWWSFSSFVTSGNLWSAGNVFGVENNTSLTDGSLILRTDNTTDGAWTTSQCLAATGFTFVAVLGTFLNTGPAAAWRVWTGGLSTPPIEQTVTNTVAPVGNFTGSTSFYVGNKGTSASAAHNGVVANVGYFATSAAAGASTHPFSLAALGAISNTEAEFVYQRFVLPFYLGQGWAPDGPIRRNGVSNASTDEMAYATMLPLFQVTRTQNVNATAFSGVTPTINGALPNATAAPPLGGPPYHPRRRR